MRYLDYPEGTFPYDNSWKLATSFLEGAGVAGRQKWGLLLSSSARVSHVTHQTVVGVRYPEWSYSMEQVGTLVSLSPMRNGCEGASSLGMFHMLTMQLTKDSIVSGHVWSSPTSYMIMSSLAPVRPTLPSAGNYRGPAGLCYQLSQGTAAASGRNGLSTGVLTIPNKSQLISDLFDPGSIAPPQLPHRPFTYPPLYPVGHPQCSS